MENLNQFELAVLERVAVNHPSIREHIPFLKVINRENTGVGMYINFVYHNKPKGLKPIFPLDIALSTNDNVVIYPLKRGLGFEVAIMNGQIQFIEFITYDEFWDGSTQGFSFVPLI